MKDCKRCGSTDATMHALCLVDTDPESMSEGEHLADVDFRLCSECVAEVSDMLEDFLGMISRKAVS